MNDEWWCSENNEGSTPSRLSSVLKNYNIKNKIKSSKCIYYKKRGKYNTRQRWSLTLEKKRMRIHDIPFGQKWTPHTFGWSDLKLGYYIDFIWLYCFLINFEWRILSTSYSKIGWIDRCFECIDNAQ